MMQFLNRDRLSLPHVTLVAVTSVNVRATVRAMEACIAQIEFADCLLFTDVDINGYHSGIKMIPTKYLNSSSAYSLFLLNDVVDHVNTSHCLVVQWDGHVLDAQRWNPEFLQYDYIGASWPQFMDGYDVGNGGFSLRSRRLMELCRDPAFRQHLPEDVAIGRDNRDWLEKQGMRFPHRDLANLFATEREGDLRKSFGYHGVFNMPRALGLKEFWSVYAELDDLGTVRHDFFPLLRDVYKSQGGAKRVGRMVKDRLRHMFIPRKKADRVA